MKTTLELDEALNGQLRRTARRHGWTFKEACARVLRAGLLMVDREERQPRSLKLHMIKGRFLVDVSDRDAVSEAIGPPELP